MTTYLPPWKKKLNAGMLELKAVFSAPDDIHQSSEPNIICKTSIIIYGDRCVQCGTKAGEYGTMINDDYLCQLCSRLLRFSRTKREYAAQHEKQVVKRAYGLISKRIRPYYFLIPMVRCTQITNHVFLGNIHATQDAILLRKYDIRCVMSVLNEPVKLPKEADIVQHEHYDIEDTSMESIHHLFVLTYPILRQAGQKSRPGNVLVHCRAGLSRSASIVIAFVMRREKWPFWRAKNYVHNLHMTDINDSFMCDLIQLEHEIMYGRYARKQIYKCLKRLFGPAQCPEQHSLDPRVFDVYSSLVYMTMQLFLWELNE